MDKTRQLIDKVLRYIHEAQIKKLAFLHAMPLLYGLVNFSKYYCGSQLQPKFICHSINFFKESDMQNVMHLLS